MEESCSSLFVIVPCFNETASINDVVASLVNHGHKVIIVDDGSNVNYSFQTFSPDVYYLKHKINLGQGAALQTGIDFALKMNAQYIATFDADSQHSVVDLNDMFQEIRGSNCHFIFGSRFLPGSHTNASLFRKLLLQFSRFTNFFISGILLSDTNNGLRVFTSEAARKFRIKENRRTHCTDIIYQVAKKKIIYAEYPVSVSYSEYSIHKGIKNTDGVSILMNMLLYKFFK